MVTTESKVTESTTGKKGFRKVSGCVRTARHCVARKQREDREEKIWSACSMVLFEAFDPSQ